MATQPEPGARNDLNARKDARRFTQSSQRNIERALDKVDRMHEGLGRPDYSHIAKLLGQLALDLSKASSSLDEMWVLLVVLLGVLGATVHLLLLVASRVAVGL